MKGTLLAPAFSATWNLLESEGVDPEPFFRAVKIDPELRYEPAFRVPVDKAEQLHRLIEEKLGDPCMSLRLADHFHPGYIGALGYAWLASSSLRTALGRLARYTRLINETLIVTLTDDEHAGVLIATLDWPTRRNRPPGLNAGAMAVLVELCRTNHGKRFNPLAVGFTHPAPDCRQAYHDYFRCPVEFAAEANTLSLSAADADKRLSSSNPQLVQLHDRSVIDYLANLDESDIQGRVKSVIIDLLPSGGITEAAVADALCLTVRSLQRRLKQNDSSYKTVLEEVRHELARNYIRDRSLSFIEISFLLGFSEQSVFSRAFKRWTGESPSLYRAGLQ